MGASSEQPAARTQRMPRTRRARPAAKLDYQPGLDGLRGIAQAGEKVASGVYFYRLAAKDFSQTKKMVLLK